MNKPANNRLLRQLGEAARDRYQMKVRVGGGIRTISRAKTIASWGADQLIIGSAAFRGGKVNLPFLREMIRKVEKSRVVIALDTAKGCIVTHGWRRSVQLRPEQAMPQLEPFCSAFLCTDVDREGTMTGANLKWFEALRRATSHTIIAAGGIKTRHDIAALERLGMDAAVGMALYKNLLR